MNKLRNIYNMLRKSQIKSKISKNEKKSNELELEINRLNNYDACLERGGYFGPAELTSFLLWGKRIKLLSLYDKKNELESKLYKLGVISNAN